jgi:hypothetical protein
VLKIIEQLNEYGVDAFIIVTCFISLVVFIVRRLEALYKWCKAKLNGYYAHKRGEEIEEETIEKLLERINEHSKRIQEIEKRAESNVQMFLDHERSAIEMIEKLTKMFVDKEIDDYRWEIINFATRISDKKPCNKDSYKHCIRTYEKYEKLLDEHGLKNGEVDISMELINESYEQKLKEGF